MQEKKIKDTKMAGYELGGLKHISKLGHFSKCDVRVTFLNWN